MIEGATLVEDKVEPKNGRPAERQALALGKEGDVNE